MEGLIAYIVRELEQLDPYEIITVSRLLNIIKRAQEKQEDDEIELDKRTGFPEF